MIKILTRKLLPVYLCGLFSLSSPAAAGEADVVNTTVEKAGNSLYNFSVTVLHADSGWEHYANKWEVLDEAGNILATRVLYHPHVDEQPFTRSLPGVNIPGDIKTVIIRAHDLLHEYGGIAVTVQLP